MPPRSSTQHKHGNEIGKYGLLKYNHP